MNAKFWKAAVGLLCLFSLGMGGMGGNGTIDVPRTDKNYTAALVDQSDVSMQLERFSFDGQTFLTGKFGRSDISVDFEKIASIVFYLAGNEVKARVQLKDGQLLEIKIDKQRPFFGVSSFANVRIEGQNIKKVNIGE